MLTLQSPQMIQSTFPHHVQADAEAGPLSVHLRNPAELSDEFIAAWQELSRNAVSANPFLNPSFVLPAAAHLPDLREPVLICIEQDDQLLGLSVFESVPGSRRFPLKHLRSWQTPHTFLDGFLVKVGHETPVLERFWDYLTTEEHDWHGVEFFRFPQQDPLAAALDETGVSRNVRSYLGCTWHRACLLPGTCVEENLMQAVSIRRAKSLRKSWRKMEKRGPTHFEYTTDPDQLSACGEELLHLEGLGWKAEAGTSLRSDPGHTLFFREMMERLIANNEVFFSRLIIGEKTIGSVVHLQSQQTACAFKLGWDPDYEFGGPGFQLMFRTAAHFEDGLPNVTLFDSCSMPGAFVERVWPASQPFSSRLYVTSPAGVVAAEMLNGLRWLRDSAKALTRLVWHAESEAES